MWNVQIPCPNCKTEVQLPSRPRSEVECPGCDARLRPKYRAAQFGISILWIIAAVAFIQAAGSVLGVILTGLLIAAWIALFALISRHLTVWERVPAQ